MQDSPSLDWNSSGLEAEFSGSQPLECTAETVRDLFNDAQYFRRNWLLSEAKRQTLQDDNRVHAGLLSPNNKLNDESALKERIKNQNREIRFLNAQRTAQISIRPFFEGQELISENLDRMRQGHSEMARGLRTTFFGFAYLTNIHEELAAIHSKDLDDLKEIAHISRSAPTTGDIDDPVLILGSLAGAAVYNWIFIEQYQSFAMTSTPLLADYQEVLRTARKCSKKCFPNDSNSES